MNKSQLRKLAAAFADGRLPAGEYRTRRRELIDDIVAGRVDIEREPPPAPAIPERPMAPSTTRAAIPWHLLLAAGSAVCVLLLAWLLWPRAEPPPAPAPAPAVSAPTVPASRALVESFLALRDFGDAAIARFESQWLALDARERDDARNALWFGSLVQALRDEVKTQKALAGLTGGDAAMARARRVIALGERLGIAEQLPPLGDAQPAPAPPAAAAPPAGPASRPPAAAAFVPGGAPAQPTGREWLAARADNELTLQIFAVNSLDRVEQLLSRHPDLELWILATDGAAPRYRVFYGVFSDADAARAAFAALPADVSADAGEAIVKSFSVVRDDLGARAPATAVPATATLAPATATPAAAPIGDYTLQLFASSSRDRCAALLGAFPALGLELREVAGDAAPYRVIYGRFASARDARDAGSALPAPLLSRIGKPLPKLLAETGIKR